MRSITGVEASVVTKHTSKDIRRPRCRTVQRWPSGTGKSHKRTDNAGLYNAAHKCHQERGLV